MPSKPAKRRHGDGALYQRADGMWLASVELPPAADGKRRRKVVSAARFSDAQRKLRDLRRQLEDNGGDLPTSTMTVKAWLERWLTDIAAPRIRPTTLAGYRNDIEHHIIPAIGRHPLDKLTPAHVRAMGQEIVAKGKSPTTALRCHRELAKALSDAQREGIVVRNVATLVDAPRKAVSTRGALSFTEAQRLLTSLTDDNPLASLWAAALLTGARRGELLGLTRDRVTDVIDLSRQLQRLDFSHGCGKPTAGAWPCGRKRGAGCPQRRLAVPPGFKYEQLEDGFCLTQPKTRAGHRVIPLVDPLASVLASHIAATDPGPHNLVWHRDDGGPLDPDAISKAWKALLHNLVLPKVPLHSARHTTATLLLELGIDTHTISAILGHSDVVVTRGYQHVSTALARDALTSLGGRFAIGSGPAIKG